jgi:vitamin B12 transporter
LSSRCVISFVLLLAFRATFASAQAQHVEVEVRSKRKIAATHSEDPSASGTTIDLTDRVTTPRSLGEVVLESPGTQVTRTGGLGAFSSVGMRGAPGEETVVLLGEIPLTAADGGAFDLSVFPAELFERVTTYRGGAPVWLGASPVGGVLQLTLRRRDRSGLNGQLGAGSFGTYHLQGGTAAEFSRDGMHHTQLVVRGTLGDFPYENDRGTRFDASDDVTFRRKNADFIEATGFQNLHLTLGGGSLQLLALGVQRGGGFPGPGSQPTPKIRRESSRALVALSYDRESGQGPLSRNRVQLIASGGYGAERFSDLYGQLGTSKQTATDDRSFRGFARAAGTLALANWLDATLLSTYTHDAYLPENHYAHPQPDPSSRHTVSSAFELAAAAALGPLRVELRPSARIDWSRSEIHARTGYTGSYEPRQSVMKPGFRIGAVVAYGSLLSLSGSVASGIRLPTMFELFGDGGLVLAAFDVRPVSSTSYDGGLTVRGRFGFLHGRAELRGFLLFRRDAIAAYRTAQFQVRHENVAEVKQYGLESSATGSLGKYFDLTGTFTWLETQTALGARLPLRPRFTSHVRPETKFNIDRRWLSTVSFAAELQHRSYTFLDYANLAYTPACTKVAASAAMDLRSRTVRLGARVDDVADARCSDQLGFPLSGRSLFFTIAYREVSDDV